MRTLYINCNSGVSGDMMLGAFLNLGVPENYLKDKLKRLKLNEFSLEIREKDVEGRQATGCGRGFRPAWKISERIPIGAITELMVIFWRF